MSLTNERKFSHHAGQSNLWSYKHMETGWCIYVTVYWVIIRHCHYNDVIMGTIVSQITSLTIVYSTVYSDADQRKHQSSVLLAICVGNSPGTGEFPAQMASNAENVSIWWRPDAYAAGSPYLIHWWTVVKWTLRKKLQWILNENNEISLKKMHLKIISAKCQPFCLTSVCKALVRLLCVCMDKSLRMIC